MTGYRPDSAGEQLAAGSPKGSLLGRRLAVDRDVGAGNPRLPTRELGVAERAEHGEARAAIVDALVNVVLVLALGADDVDLGRHGSSLLSIPAGLRGRRGRGRPAAPWPVAGTACRPALCCRSSGRRRASRAPSRGPAGWPRGRGRSAPGR